MNNIYKYKNWFLSAYVINACLILLVKLILGFINEDILSDTIVSHVVSCIYTSFSYEKTYMFIHIDGIGPLSIFLIVFFVFTILKTLDMLLNKKNEKLILYKALLFVLGIIIISLLIFIPNFHMPFSLLESLAVVFILFPITSIFNKAKLSEKICRFISIFLIAMISIASYLYFFMDYFIEI